MKIITKAFDYIECSNLDKETLRGYGGGGINSPEKKIDDNFTINIVKGGYSKYQSPDYRYNQVNVYFKGRQLISASFLVGNGLTDEGYDLINKLWSCDWVNTTPDTENAQKILDMVLTRIGANFAVLIPILIENSFKRGFEEGKMKIQDDMRNLLGLH
jgi:hypothetical protein